MNETITVKTPWHLWVVGALSFLFNLGGANDYLQSQLRNESYIKAASDISGVSIEEMITYMDSFPLWAQAFWAIGVWGAVLGSLLLLLRTRYAFHAFAASLVGLAVSTVFQFSNPLPSDMSSDGKTFSIIFMIVIWIVMLGLTYYARRMTAKGVLR